MLTIAQYDDFSTENIWMLFSKRYNAYIGGSSMKLIKALFSRTMFMILAVLLEVLLIFSAFRWFNENVAWIEAVLRIFSIIFILFIIKNSRHLSSDMLWIVMISLFPVPGMALFLLLGAGMVFGRTYRSLTARTAAQRSHLPQDPDVLQEMKESCPFLAGQFRYISESAGFPFYRNESISYYPLGDTGFPVILEELKKAQEFIFLEYFIIEEGEMWNSMLAILEEKAAQGLDVRVMYDDFGSFMTLSWDYAKKLESKGIRCVPFNRVNPLIGAITNHRDHRKILVIDGKTAFSGGVNLADEYINHIEKHGHWKDNIIKVTGEAVWSYTVMFLTHWNALCPTDESFETFQRHSKTDHTDGYIAPYGDTPLDDEITAQYIYMSMINQANDYCYIFTPYLIIDTEMINALILAAKRGVDVRIVTPGIPDKKLVFSITRSYYRQLIEGGVKIYEYTPGFVHSKVFLCDDETAAVGTINLDYRSLYLHFENSTFLYGCSAIQDIRKDFEDTFPKCHQVALSEAQNGFFKEMWLAVLRLFAPMM